MPKFTLILEFRGGTYIHQVRAVSPRAALSKVAAGSDSNSRVFGALLDENQVVIDGIANCWCSFASLQGGLALVNIVKTAE